jgi:uncharacterized protein
MSTDHIRYDLLAQEALRGVVRQVLADVAKSGLPGEHHFYVTFDTRAPGLKISPRLKSLHPEEMTIVLQHQFWDLSVTVQGFEIGLSFKGIPERLSIPFAAVKGFFDPSVQFGLQFETLSEKETPQSEASAAPEEARQPKKAAAPTTTAKLSLAPPSAPEPEPPAPAPGGKVVKFDRSRKK